MVDSRVKMHCDEIVISDAILRTVSLEMTLFIRQEKKKYKALNNNIISVDALPSNVS